MLERWAETKVWWGMVREVKSGQWVWCSYTDLGAKVSLWLWIWVRRRAIYGFWIGKWQGLRDFQQHHSGCWLENYNRWTEAGRPFRMLFQSSRQDVSWIEMRRVEVISDQILFWRLEPSGFAGWFNMGYEESKVTDKIFGLSSWVLERWGNRLLRWR